MSPDAPRLFFLHLPKTAGTTLAALLEQRYHVDDVMPRRLFGKNALYVTPHDVEARLDQVRAYRLVRGHFGGPIRERFFPAHASLVIVREPRARIVSLYRDWRTKSAENLADAPPAERELAELARTRDLARFLAAGHPLVERLFADAQARQLSGFLYDQSPPDADAACAALDRFDVVGTTEMLDATVALLSRRLGWARPERVERLNASRTADGAERLDGAALARLDELTRVDRIVHAHAQSLLSRRLAEAIPDQPAPAPVSPAPTPVEVDMRAPLDGSGWHVREGLDTDAVWRWTGPERESHVMLALTPGVPYRVEVEVVSVIAPDILDGLHVLASGRSLYLDRRTERAGRTVLEYRLPAWLVTPSGPTRLGLLVPRTISHQQVQPETADPRPKGIAVTRIAASPL